MRNLDVTFASTQVQIDAYLERYRPWLEAALGCPLAGAVTVDMNLPFGDQMSRELLTGVPVTSTVSEDVVIDFLKSPPWLRRGPLRGLQLAGTQDLEVRPSERVPALVTRWELPPGLGPGIRLEPSSSGPTLGWHARWMHTPTALWLRDCSHAVVAVQVPVVHHKYGHSRESSRTCVVINRNESKAALVALRQFFALRPHRIVVSGGGEIPLDADGYDWSRVVLTHELTREVQEDFERFLDSRAWFQTQRLASRRSYLLHGPPGNGKTSVARIMACHPDVSTFSLNFSAGEIGDSELSEMFLTAARACPALIIIEDLDRLFGREGAADWQMQQADNRTAITLPHLLSCLDGVSTPDGVIVVATANRIRDLEPALFRRFNVIAGLPLPTAELRTEYFRRRTPLSTEAIERAVRESEGFTFAQLAEAYQVAGMRAFARGTEIRFAELAEALAKVRRAAHRDARGGVGFGGSRNGEH